MAKQYKGGWSKGSRKSAKKKDGPPAPAPYVQGKCPACEADVVWQRTRDGIVTPCEPQRRLVIFDYEPNKLGLPKREDGPVILITERRGDVVIGRKATKEETTSFSEIGNPGKSFTIGRQGHLQNCTRWDLWLNGEAQTPILSDP